MAHFAELDENNKVLRIIVIADSDTADNKGVEKEEIGIAFCKSLFGEDTKWVQTSYNGKIRKIFASTGGVYDSEKDVFIPKQPDKWHIWNEENWLWETPIPAPDSSKFISIWNSHTGEWDSKPIIQ